MERRELLTWLLGVSFVGILCICLVGRPKQEESSGFPWIYTTAPTAAPVSAAALVAAASTSGPVAPPAVQTASPLPDPAAPLTTAPTPFVANSVVNKNLKEGIAILASQMPGYVIRPYQMGTTLPPGPYNDKRISVGYDPVSLAITQVVTG